jgi:hypothetical protein
MDIDKACKLLKAYGPVEVQGHEWLDLAKSLPTSSIIESRWQNSNADYSELYGQPVLAETAAFPGHVYVKISADEFLTLTLEIYKECEFTLRLHSVPLEIESSILVHLKTIAEQQIDREDAEAKAKRVWEAQTILLTLV